MMRSVVCTCLLARACAWPAALHKFWHAAPQSSLARRSAIGRGNPIVATDDIAAIDAQLCAEARAATAAGDHAAARLAWAELDDVRGRAASPPPRAPTPNVELLTLVESLGRSRRYVAYLKLHRTELRRLSTKTSLARRASEIPLASLTPPYKRPSMTREAHQAVDALVNEAEAADTPAERALAWEAVEEILSRDNSVACAPSLDDEGVVEDDLINLEVELCLEHLESLANRAEMSGAFSSLRQQV